MLRRIIGFIAFALTSLTFLFFALIMSQDTFAKVILIIIIILTIVGLSRHWFECTDCKANGKFVFDKAKLFTFLAGFFAVVITWFMNHTMGVGAFIANGTVGLIAATIFPPPLAGAAYAASFVGMSGLNVLPSFSAAALGGIVVGIVLVFTAEIYAGIGGKGGTTAALAAQITKFILILFR